MTPIEEAYRSEDRRVSAEQLLRQKQFIKQTIHTSTPIAVQLLILPFDRLRRLYKSHLLYSNLFE
jgi:hypothetical protein